MNVMMLWNKVKQLWEGRLASESKRKVVCSPEIPAARDPDLVVANIPFWWFSSLAPTKQDIANATIETDFMGDGALVNSMTLPTDGVLFDSDVLYGGYLYHNGEASEIILVVAYQSGAHTVNVGGADFSVNIPKAGIYIAGQSFYAVNIQWSEIKQIDPKFIPGAVLPVVEIADLTALTEDENKALTSCIGKPCIVNFTFAGTMASTIATYARSDTSHAFLITIADSMMTLTSADGITWTPV